VPLRTIADPRLSPDGSRVAFVVRDTAGARLAVSGIDGGERAVDLDPAPSVPHATGGGVIGWAGDDLVYVAGNGSIRVAGRRVLVPWGGCANVATSPDGTRAAFVFDERDVGVVPVDATAWPTRVSNAANDFALDPTWSPDGARLAWHEWDDPAMPWDASRLVDDTGAALVGGGAVAQPRYGPDGTLGHLTDGPSGWLSLWCHPDGDAEHGLPAWGPGVRTWAWSPDGDRVAFVRNEAGFGRLCVLDRRTSAVDEIAKGWHHGLDWRGRHLVAVRTGARTPPELVAYDDVTWQRRRLAAADVDGEWDAAGLVEPEVVTWPGAHGRVYAAGPDRPLVLWVHGGPTDQLRVEFNPLVAWLVAEGWAVLAADYRGSTGWGRAFQQAMNGGWGVVDVDDCAAGVQAAIDERWCDGRPAVAIGGSAGGFTVLHLLARHPDLFAAGVARFPVGDLLDLDARTHRLERHYNDTLVGPVEARRERSPIAFADRIRRPVLLFHGAADRIVPVDQSRALAERLPDVEFHVYEGEGHGWRQQATIDDERARIVSFLQRRVAAS
jgi:dipeptidyl aminopeptidase/acylaminoacyl peptidase